MRKFQIERVLDAISVFVKKKRAPVVELMEVRGNDPFHILVSTILSARTNDKTTIEVTRRMFKAIKAPDDLAKLSVTEMERMIYPVSFYKNKAKSLKALPLALSRYGNEVPRTLDDLLTLPGVGRKTANIVLVETFDTAAISVDTHVHRITNRLGYVRTKTPHETELALRKKLPKKYWKMINHTLVAFGQTHCTPISPRCSICPVAGSCKRVGVKGQR